MKIKPQLIAIIVILFVGGALILLSFNARTVGYLFSRSIDMVTTIDTDESGEPRPAVESLDGIVPEKSSLDTEKLLQGLQSELLKTDNDPEKAMELRRRIRLLQLQQEVPPSTETDKS